MAQRNDAGVDAGSSPFTLLSLTLFCPSPTKLICLTLHLISLPLPPPMSFSSSTRVLPPPPPLPLTWLPPSLSLSHSLSLTPPPAPSPSQMELSRHLRLHARTIEGKQQLFINAFAKALEVKGRERGGSLGDWGLLDEA